MTLLLLALAACGPKTAEVATPPAAPPPPASATQQAVAALLADMDRAANPCEDFYRYACGSWLDNTPLPADKPVWTRSFSTIDEDNRTWINALLERAAADPGAGDDDWRRVGTYFAACMNETARAEAGVKPLAPLFERIGTVKDAASFLTVAGELSVLGATPLVGGWVDADFANPKLTILYLFQDGLGLPDRDYYLVPADDAKGQENLTAYQAHVGRMLAFAGVADAEAAAGRVVEFEKKLATFSIPRDELQDPARIYNKVDLAGLQKAAPKLPWEAWLSAIGAPTARDISLHDAAWFTKLQELVLATDPGTMREYLAWHTIHATASALSPDIAAEGFAFYGKQLAGSKEQEPLWKRCVSSTSGSLGEVLGKVYVAERFGGASKPIADEMIDRVADAFEAGLPALAWMDDATRSAAVEKKNSVTRKIGYPETWRDYSSIALGPLHLDNWANARRYEHAREVAKIGKAPDPAEWFMAPQMVNAYYNPLQNEIVFPAGILQPPFFLADYPAPMNYGGIGMVMGHELTHGFDDSGRQFDGTGTMRAWWSEAAVTAFEAQTQCIVDQYAAYTVPDGTHVNGELTLGENIADLGGVRTAFRAWKGWEQAHEPAGPYADGLTNDQLFFVSYAQGWCTKSTPELETLRVRTDSHSPAEFRVNGPLQNLPEFHQAFGCKEGQAMVRAPQCEVW